MKNHHVQKQTFGQAVHHRSEVRNGHVLGTQHEVEIVRIHVLRA